MRTRITKAIFAAIILILGITLLSGVATGTEYTKSYSGAKVTLTNNYGYAYRFTHTFVAATDTIICTLPQPPRLVDPEDSLLYMLNVGVSSANGDSTDIGVRFQVSSDNSSWTSITIGTDSTTWATTETGTSYKVTSVLLGWSATSGTLGVANQPYHRLKIVGITGNNIATKLRVDLVPIKQQ
jgi:hypothetical protein